MKSETFWQGAVTELEAQLTELRTRAAQLAGEKADVLVALEMALADNERLKAEIARLQRPPEPPSPLEPSSEPKPGKGPKPPIDRKAAETIN